MQHRVFFSFLNDSCNDIDIDDGHKIDDDVEADTEDAADDNYLTLKIAHFRFKSHVEFSPTTIMSTEVVSREMSNRSVSDNHSYHK